MTGNDGNIREPDVNKLIGDFLCGNLVGCTIIAEKRDVIEEKPERQPDILIVCQKGSSAMVIECEFDPADKVEDEATRHLGMSVKGFNSSVDFAIALVLPKSLKCPENRNVETATYKFYVFDSSPNSSDNVYSGDLNCVVSVIRGLFGCDS